MVNLKSPNPGLDCWLSSYEYSLLFQRTHIQFPAPCMTDKSVSPCLGTPVPFYSPREHQTCKEHIDTHAKHSCMQKIKKLKMYQTSSTHWYVIITQSLSCCKALASPVNPDTSCQGPWKPEGLLFSLQANPQAYGCLALHRIERTFSN